MVNKINNKKTSNKCFQCGSDLIFVSQEIVQPDGSRYPQINTVYRCSNADCQKKKDKEKIDRQKLRETQAVTQKQRMEKIQEKRKQNQKAKIQAD